MFFENYNMISINENEKMYFYQQSLIKNYMDTKDDNVLVEIAILLSLSPVADYYEAIKMLKAISIDTNNLRVYILGSYLMNEYVFDEENHFLTVLRDSLKKNESKKNKSIACYLIGKDMKKKGCNDEAIIWFEKSVEYGPEYVNNYLELSELSLPEYKQKYIDIARSNVKNILTERAILKMSIEDFSSYDNFIDEFILGVKLTEYVYKSYFHPIRGRLA